MESLLSSNPTKTKEKLLTLLLLFLIVLLPLSLLSGNQTPRVEITGLYGETINDSAKKVYIKLHNNLNEPLDCKLSVSYYKYGILYDKELQPFGKLGPEETKQGFVVIHFLGGKSTFRIRPECFVRK